MEGRKNRIIMICTAVFTAVVLMFSIYAVISHYINESSNVYGEELDAEDTDIGKDVEAKSDNEVTKEEGKLTRLTSEKPYAKDLVDQGSRNILVVGEDKENNLYDTIMIVSISKKNNSIKIIQIARDAYVEYSERVKSFLEERNLINEPGIFKINYTHNIGVMMGYEGRFDPYTSMNFLTGVVEEKFDIKIDDFVRVDIQSFRKAVDLMGGVNVYVPYDMNYDDPVQDLSIHIEKGMQELNGEQAEGFVRYRQGYDIDGVFHSYGDVGRKQNQITFIKAFIDQHATLENIDKAPEILKALNLRHSVGLGDMLWTYMGICRDIIANNYEVNSVILTGEPKIIKGSSYIIIESD